MASEFCHRGKGPIAVVSCLWRPVPRRLAAPLFMSSQASWLPLLVLLLAVLFGALILVVALLLRGRVRNRMAGIDRRLGDMQLQMDSLRVPGELAEIEALIRRGETTGKLSAQTAEELRHYVEILRSEAQEDL